MTQGQEAPRRRRVVVTGMGAVTPVGIGVDTFWKSVLEGISGVDVIRAFDASAFPSRIGAEVKGFKGKDYVEKRKSLKLMGRNIQFGVASARMAAEDAGLGRGTVDPTRLGVIMGAGIVNSNLFELSKAISDSLDVMGNFDPRKFADDGIRHLFPLSLLKHLPNMVSAHISILHDCRGPSNTVVTACASGTQAVGEAMRTIARGEADVVLTGGADSRIEPLGLTGYCLLGALSKRNDDPARASRPFERDRDGFIVGEGAAVLVLEELEHALARRASIYGEILGYGSAADSYRVTDLHPEGRGGVLAMKRALQDSGVSVDELDMVSAHGTSTLQNDRVETAALKEVLGEKAYSTPVSALKSMIGHTGAASGAVQLVATLKALQENVVPPTINYETPDPECDLDYVPNVLRHLPLRTALSNSFGFGGQNAALIVRKYDPEAS